MLKITVQVVFFLLTLSYTFAQEKVSINTDNIEIVRDKYGVPHIFSNTDVEAVYGIAWAQCEDNFNVMQDNLAIAKGVFGKIEGKNGAILDFVVQLFELDKQVESRYEKDISQETEMLLQAYVKAINRYASLHPSEIKLKEIFPITPKDVLQGYLFNFLVINNTILDVIKVADNKMDLFLTEGNVMGAGSNAMAYNKNKTTDGKAYLVANPHQPIDSPANFWELSVHSKEGMEFFGVTFSAGGVTPFMGSNRKLAWTHTTNYEDYSDVFELKMHPSKKNYYEYDGEWIPLEEKKAKLKVKLGPIVLPIKKTYYTSKYGPTLKNKKGYYSFRSNAFFSLRFIEQNYKMILAQNYDEFWEALQIQALTSQTVTYADFEQNIMHISNGILPKRNEKYNWRKMVAGNTSETLWSYDEKYALDELVYVKNPKCGYVFNSNNTPMDCTAPDENPKVEDYPTSFGLLTTNTLRAKRFKMLIAEHDSISFEEIKAIRDDTKTNTADMSARSFLNQDDIPVVLEKTPDLADVKAIFDKWNGDFAIENKQAILAALATMYMTDYLASQYASFDNTIPEEIIVEAFRKAKRFLLKHYGTLEIELGKVQKIVRGDKELPMYGNPQTLANGYFEPYGKDKLKCNKGDSYIMYARFGDKGLEKMSSINVFGNSSKPDSPHYTDQLEMYVNKETKEVELDLKQLKANAIKAYNPK
ncbi:MAG: penicillin acylase family protein [Chitinophagales bacterium]